MRADGTTDAPDLEPAAARRRAAALNLVFNYVISAVTVIQGIALVPLYLRSFDLATYGVWLASGNILSLIGVLDLGLNLVFAQQLATAAGARDAGRFSRTTGAGLLITFGSAAAVAGLAAAVSPWLPSVLQAPPNQHAALSFAFWTAAIGAGATLVQLGCGAILQAWQATALAGTAGVAATLVGVGVTLAGLFAGLGVRSLGLGYCARGATGAAVVLGGVAWGWRARRLPRPSAERAEVVALGRLTAPVFVSRLSGVILSNSEAAIVSIVIDPGAAAVLALTGRAFQVCMMFVAPVGSSAFAGLAHLAGEGSESRLREVLRELFALTAAVAGFLLGTALALNGGFVDLWVGSGRFGGLALSTAACLSIAAQTRTQLTNMVLTAVGRIREAAWVSVAEAAVRVPVVVLMLWSLGVIGLPLASAVSALVVSVPLQARLLPPRGSAFLARLGLFASGLLAGIGAAALGQVLALVLPRPSGWATFVLEAGVAGVLMSLVTLATSRESRRLTRRIGGRLWRRASTVADHQDR